MLQFWLIGKAARCRVDHYRDIRKPYQHFQRRERIQRFGLELRLTPRSGEPCSYTGRWAIP